MKPESVLEALDFEGFAVEDARGLLLISSVWKELSGDQPFPLEVGRSHTLIRGLHLTSKGWLFQQPW